MDLLVMRCELRQKKKVVRRSFRNRQMHALTTRAHLGVFGTAPTPRFILSGVGVQPNSPTSQKFGAEQVESLRKKITSGVLVAPQLQL